MNREIKGRDLWRDSEGFVVSAEVILMGTILVIGILVGLVSVRDQVVQELADTAAAMAILTQTFSLAAITGHSASTGGSVFNDTTDYCDAGFPILCDYDPPGQAATRISLSVDAGTET